MDDEQTTGEGQEIPKKEEPVVIPPENPSQVSVPPEFASPVLFQKDENLPSHEVEEPLPQEKKSHTKTIIMIVVLVLAMAVGTVTVVNVLVEKKFETFLFDDNNQFVSEGFELSEDEADSETTLPTCEGGSPFIDVIEAEQALVPGEKNTFSWKLCGIGENLFDSATISYYPLEEETEEGNFSLLDCLVPLGTFENEIQTMDWDIPPFLEASSSPDECSPPTINFLNAPYRYTLSVSYAGGQYEDTSDYFLIDGTNYTYVPPQFEDYQIVPDTDFARSPFIDASAPEFLKELIFPAYFEAPPLFANYYRWYVIPNGPSFLIDLRDGKVHDAPGTGGQIIGKPYSSLFLAFEEKGDDFGESPGTHVVRWSLFDEESKTFDLIEEKLCIIVIQGEPEISDCVPKS